MELYLDEICRNTVVVNGDGYVNYRHAYGPEDCPAAARVLAPPAASTAHSWEAGAQGGGGTR